MSFGKVKQAPNEGFKLCSKQPWAAPRPSGAVLLQESSPWGIYKLFILYFKNRYFIFQKFVSSYSLTIIFHVVYILIFFYKFQRDYILIYTALRIEILVSGS